MQDTQTALDITEEQGLVGDGDGGISNESLKHYEKTGQRPSDERPSERESFVQVRGLLASDGLSLYYVVQPIELLPDRSFGRKCHGCVALQSGCYCTDFDRSGQRAWSQKASF